MVLRDASASKKNVQDSAPPRSSEEKSPRPLAASVFLATNKKGKKQPLTKMMPRVKCSLCEFTGKEGKKMMDHMKKEHEVDFNC